MQSLINEVREGFSDLKVGEKYKESALVFLEDWVTNDEYKDYLPQIKHLVSNKSWNYILDSFYQVMPFGTGGRRGEVGIGPNRINKWSVKASAQGHSQYLLKKYGDQAKERGIVLVFDVRQFPGSKYLSDDITSPVNDLSSKGLAMAAAKVYAANGIKVYTYEDIRTTPEMSFAIRQLGAVAGANISASHNPPDHNGKKIYDEFGGQLIPPDDEELVNEVTDNVREILEMPYNDALAQGLISILGKDIDDAYINAAASVSLSDERDVNIVYTPLHGCGVTSVYRVMKQEGFDIREDPKTSNPSGAFENITFNIPNPEVIESFNTTLKFAKEEDADIILNSDPDADRFGAMVKQNDDWIFLDGHQIATILSEYVVQKRKHEFKGNEVIIKTSVTTGLVKEICEQNNIGIIGDLLVGYKYIADEMNKLEREGKIGGVLFSCEESNGYLAGDYSRDKDAVTPAIWLSELLAEQKKEGKGLIDYLDDIYVKYGYFKNYLTEVRMLGAMGHEKIHKIQAALRSDHPNSFGEFEIDELEDCQLRKPIVSETDRRSKDMLIFHLKPKGLAMSLRVTIRPSGTEPKIKMYFEIGTGPMDPDELVNVRSEIDQMMMDLEKAVMLHCFNIIDVDFPERGFLLFWQLPLDDKMKYFEIETEIEGLRDIADLSDRKKALLDLISFLGADPVEKMDKAFKAKYKMSVLEYLDIS